LVNDKIEPILAPSCYFHSYMKFSMVKQ